MSMKDGRDDGIVTQPKMAEAETDADCIEATNMADYNYVGPLLQYSLI